MYFCTWRRSVKVRTDVSDNFNLVKGLKNILIGPFEFAYYLQAIHAVKLTKIVGVESVQSGSSPPQSKIASYPCENQLFLVPLSLFF